MRDIGVEKKGNDREEKDGDLNGQEIIKTYTMARVITFMIKRLPKIIHIFTHTHTHPIFASQRKVHFCI
jgi:hypothetical protein